MTPTADELHEMVNATVRVIAMQIAELDVADRERAFELARTALEDTIRQTGVDPSTPTAAAMINAMCEGIKSIVALMPGRGNA